MTFTTIARTQYRLACPEYGVQFDVDRLRRDRNGELVGELTVACSILGAAAIDGVLSVGAFNFSSIRARQERARALGERARVKNKIDFGRLLEELCQRVLSADRNGRPVVVLSDLPRPGTDEQVVVHGFRIPAHHPTILFGDGGTLKSYFLLYVLGFLARAGLNAALFDWELDENTHRVRLEELFGTDMPHVKYVRCERPLVYELDHLARVVRREAIDYAGFDSCGFAADGPPEAAEAALGYFGAVREIGIGSLHIAHTTKSGELAEHRPFGSTFWHNSARSTWFVKRVGEAEDGRPVNLGFFHRKTNIGSMQRPIGFEACFRDRSVVFAPADITAIEELCTSLPLWQRIQGEVRRGPKTIAEIAESLGVKADSVEKAVKRKTLLFTRVSGHDGIRRVALVEGRLA